MNEVSNYEIVTVAQTEQPYDKEIFDKVIALRNKLYENPDELESVDAIKQRLSGKNKSKDPVDLKINAIMQDGEVKGFSILETYLDAQGNPISGCMTYANADPAFARSAGGMEALAKLHKASVGGADYPIIVEINPGDAAVINAAKQKGLFGKGKPPFALDNNDDPLVVEMAIKLGVDPASISAKFANLLKEQVKANGVAGSTLDVALKDMIEMGQLKDESGKVVSAIVPAFYNALNLDEVADPKKPFKGGPKNLHMAIVNLPGNVNYSDVEKAYCGLCESIVAGNGDSPKSIEEARATLAKQEPYAQTRTDIAAVAALHAQMQHRAERVGAGNETRVR